MTCRTRSHTALTATASSRYQTDVILNSADEWITMDFNQTKDTSDRLNLNSFSLFVVFSIFWSFVFILVFSISLFFLYIQQNKKQKSQPNGEEVTDADVSLNEVSEKMKKREKNKSYKERVNSVYYEWFTDHPPQRKPATSDCTV